MEAFKPILPNEFRKPVKLFEYLARNDKYTPFIHWFTLLRVYMTIPVFTASRNITASRVFFPILLYHHIDLLMSA